jgi:hypothetical protein
MKDENKSINITFRLSPQYKKWLEELTKYSKCKTSSEYLAREIYHNTQDMLIEKAKNESLPILGKEFGIHDITKFDNDVWWYSKKYFNFEKRKEFINRLYNESIKNFKRLCDEYGFSESWYNFNLYFRYRYDREEEIEYINE